MNFFKKRDFLVEILDEGILLLNKFKVEGWTKQLNSFKNSITNLNDKNKVLDFLKQNERELYGGMGSLADLVIAPENGHIANNFDQANKEVVDYTRKIIAVWQNLEKELSQ